MKKIQFILPLLFAISFVKAQVGSLTPVVIGSCGGFSTTPNFTIASNTGEVAVTTSSAPTLTLTQGFEQPSDLVDTMTGECGVVFYHGLTPNGDGHNDIWVIDYVDLHPENTVEIYNRWGALVWKGTNYNNKQGDPASGDVVFEGKDLDGRALEDGTYFFIFKTTTCSGDRGWIEISGHSN